MIDFNRNAIHSDSEMDSRSFSFWGGGRSDRLAVNPNRIPSQIFIGYDMDIKQLERRAEKLRINKTYYEHLFLELLSKNNSQTSRYSPLFFRFQQVIAPYIVDFYFPNKKLVLEIDGNFHTEDINQESHDSARDDYIMSLGLTIWRISNDDVLLRRNEIIKSVQDYSYTRIKGLVPHKNLTRNNNAFIEGFTEKKFKRAFYYFLCIKLYELVKFQYINTTDGIRPFKRPLHLKGGLEHL